MNRAIRLTFLSTLLAGCVGAAQAQTLTEAQWREDLEFLAKSIRTQHPDPFYVVTEESFQRLVEDLNERIPRLEDHEILVELARIAALIQDGHTAIRGGYQFLTGRYPLRLYLFADGIYVRGAPTALAGAVGARLLKVGDKTAEEAFSTVAAVTPHDNEMTLKSRVPDAMIIPEILHALGITPDRDRARFIFIDSKEREFTLDLAPVPFDLTLDWIDANGSDTEPLYLQHSDRNYWHHYLEESETLYVQYNRVRDAADETLQEYFERVSSLAMDLPIQRVVLDLRFNGGGNDFLNAPVMEWVESSSLVAQRRFYLIIGRETYSAAQKLVTRLEATTDVVLVGEPTGGSPVHFGDAVKLSLPNSDVLLTVSKVFHADAPGDTRRSIEPDLRVPLFARDYLGGRDPCLEAILAAEKAASPKGR